MKKIYFVYREVVADSITDAAKQKGYIYQISLADDNTQLKLVAKQKRLGFKKK